MSDSSTYTDEHNNSNADTIAISSFNELMDEIEAAKTKTSKSSPTTSMVLVPYLQLRRYSISSADTISPRRFSIKTGAVKHFSNKGRGVSERLMF